MAEARPPVVQLPGQLQRYNDKYVVVYDFGNIGMYQ